MITLLPTQSLTPAALPDGHEAFVALLRLVTDSDAAKKRLEELTDAGVNANEAILAANEALKNLEAARKLHDETLRRERQEHQQKITQANGELASKDQQVNSQLAERERAVKQLEAKAAADAEAAAQLRQDLERRLTVIRSAMKGAA